MGARRGSGESVIGWLWAIGVIAEVILFWLIGRGVGRGADSRILMLMGAVAALIRFTGLALTPGIAVTFMLQIPARPHFRSDPSGDDGGAYAAGTTRQSRQGAGTVFRRHGAGSRRQAWSRAAGCTRNWGPATYLLMLPLALAGGACVLAGAARMRADKPQPQSSRSGG